MNERLTTPRPANKGGNFLTHIIAAGAGIVLMVAGVGMGVTVVLLPLGIPVGLAGLAVFFWGLFGRPEEEMVHNAPVESNSVKNPPCKNVIRAEAK